MGDQYNFGGGSVVLRSSLLCSSHKSTEGVGPIAGTCAIVGGRIKGADVRGASDSLDRMTPQSLAPMDQLILPLANIHKPTLEMTSRL